MPNHYRKGRNAEKELQEKLTELIPEWAWKLSPGSHGMDVQGFPPKLNISLKTRGAFPFNDSNQINMVRVDNRRGLDKWFAVVPLRVIAGWLNRDAVKAIRQAAAASGKDVPETVIERILELEDTALGFAALGQTLRFVWRIEMTAEEVFLHLGLAGDGWDRYERITL